MKNFLIYAIFSTILNEIWLRNSLNSQLKTRFPGLFPKMLLLAAFYAGIRVTLAAEGSQRCDYTQETKINECLQVPYPSFSLQESYPAISADAPIRRQVTRRHRDALSPTGRRRLP